MKSTPIVSLLVCTYNRASLLPQTIQSLLSQEFDWGDYEILVVDNACTDDTKEVVQSIQQHHAKVHYVYEPTLGVAVARNTGARRSQAKYIAYFDDDITAARDCLQHLMGPFFQIKPPPVAVMGKVDLLWEGDRPIWFPERFETLLSRFDRGLEPRFLTPDEYLLTTNVAFERNIFLRIGGIREDLSRKGRMFICSGDNEIFRRLIQSNLPVYYQPNARIQHWTPRRRQTRLWLVKRIFGEGTSQALVEEVGKPKTRLLRRMLYDLKLCTRMAFNFIISLLSRERDDAVNACCALVQQTGRVTAELQMLLGLDVRTFGES